MAAVAQGEVWWVDDGEPDGSEPGYARPWVIIQNNRTNATRLKTAIACPLTTILRLANAPGNVLLEAGEGGITRASVVNVSKVTAYDIDRFTELIGRIPQHRVNQIVRGLNQLLVPSEP